MPDDGRPAMPEIACIRGFAEASPMALALLQGPAHRIRYLNPAFLAAAGRPAEALLGRPAAKAFPALTAVQQQALERVRREGTPCRAAGIALPLDGSGPRLWDAELSAVQGAGGRIAGVLVLLREMTKGQAGPQEAPPAVQDSRYRTLVDAGALALWRTTPDGALLDTGSWTTLTGQTAAEASGEGWLRAIHREDRERVRTAWRAAILGGAAFEVEYRLRTPGGWRWTAARAVPRREAEGRILEWVGVNTDIEARKQAKGARRASEDRFRTLAEAMPHLVWQTDAEGRPDYLNRRWQAVTGLDLAAIAGRGWMAALHPEDAARLHADWAEALASGREYDVDARIRTAGGEYRWHRVKAAPVRDRRGRIRHWVGTCTEVEEQHRAEAALREALAARDRLAREAEHRIKNSLQLVAALLRLQSGRVPEPVAREALEAATLRVQAVAEAHRALQMSPDLRSIRLADMLRELAAGATVQHPGSDIRIRAPDDLALDAERAIPLALILAELVADTRRHRQPEGPGHPVRLEAEEEAGRLAVTVADDGIGLPGGSPAERLGDTVVRALARQIGAVLTTENTAGGTRVTLRLGLGQGQGPGPG